MQEENQIPTPVPENTTPVVSVPVPVQSEAQPASSTGDTGPMEYASFWQRFAASLVDGFLVVGILFLVVFVLAGVGGVLSPERDTAFLVFILPMYLLVYAYSPFMIGRYGATLGKMAVHIKVVDANGQRPSWGTAISREIVGRLVSGLIPFAIGYLWMLWDSQKQTVHDKIAGTYIVKTK